MTLFKIIQNNKGFAYIFSNDTGRIERIHVKNGDQFERNQLLIEISLKDSRENYDSLDKYSMKKEKSMETNDFESESKRIKTSFKSSIPEKKDDDDEIEEGEIV